MVLWCRHQRGQNVEGRLEARERESSETHPEELEAGQGGRQKELMKQRMNGLNQQGNP